ncbi:uncharacterized protein EI90DRAFT_2119 [Cantharellus anzutake]|uniref:uncharacterized protein n=1 Tax=Cantharellus anzutake TaxID=1750568 RepID=UPI001909033C|nr:uncharacterized protein EI90DRAFT_2119 [Cantharellus anzutake]KAF8343772.1 hypothetical protein EI90DRAFT_2119 [Cantharellus anzutake]
MKADDRRHVADNGQTHTAAQTVVEQAQQTHNQDQHAYLQYSPVDFSHPSMAQYQQAMATSSAHPQQAPFGTDEVEEVDENYAGEYDPQHQQLQSTSEAAGDSDENENGKRKVPVDGEERVDGDGNLAGEGERAKKKRRRQALSCTECKRRKIRCDRSHPCSPCARRGDQDKCRWTLLDPM